MPNTPGTLAYPTSLDDVISLFETTDSAATTLNGGIDASVTTIIVVSTTLFPSTGSITIESEIIYYTGKSGTTFTGCIRGRAGTTAATHSTGLAVNGRILASHHNVLASAIIALETKVGLITVARTDAGQTFTGINTFTSPKIITDISDTNGNELLKFTSTANAINEFTITNAATSGHPSIAASGGGTDINVVLTPKGAGIVSTAASLVVAAGGFGTAASPALSVFGAGAGRGLFGTNGGVGLSNGSSQAYFSPGNDRSGSSGHGIRVDRDGEVGWSGTQNDAGQITDLRLFRNTTGVLEINGATVGQWGSLLCGVRDAGTNTVVAGITIGHQTSGIQANNAIGLGIAIDFNINDTTTADANAARLAAVWSDSAHSTRTGDLVFSTVNSGTLAERMRLTGAGQLHIGDGTESPIVAGSSLYIAVNGTAAFTVRDCTNDVELLNYAYSGGVIIGSTSNHDCVLRSNNTGRIAIRATGTIGLAAATVFGWSSTSDPVAASDAAFARVSPGLVEINNGTAGTLRDITLRNITISGTARFNGTNSTGAGSALFGTNSPASTLTAPYTWITVIVADGSTCYMPVWK